MIFNSYSFMVFFPVVLFGVFLLPKKARSVWLLIASYVFYMGWNAKYALLLAFATLTTYAAGILIEDAAKNGQMGRAKAALVVSIVLNLACLGVFKYSSFILHNLNAALKIAGVKPLSLTLKIVLPVGISFYTFQSIGYVADVYKAACGRQNTGGVDRTQSGISSVMHCLCHSSRNW